MDGMAVEPLGVVTAIMYATPNLSSRQNVVPVNTVTPGALRAPGENPSACGIECAMDELAYKLGMDPLEIRLMNYAERGSAGRQALVDAAVARGFRLPVRRLSAGRSDPMRHAPCVTAII